LPLCGLKGRKGWSYVASSLFFCCSRRAKVRTKGALLSKVFRAECSDIRE